MPGRNGRGPLGQGPKTGRGTGRCRGSNAAGDAATGGLGFGLGRGRGRGRGGRGRQGQPGPGQAAVTPPTEGLETALADLKARIQALETRAAETAREETK